MKKSVALVLGLLCIMTVVTVSNAWEFTELFYANDSRMDQIDDNGINGDQSVSKISCVGTDNGTVRAIIWGNDWPEHYHEVIDPDENVTYRLVSDPHRINLFGLFAEEEVFGATFPSTTDYISVKIVYPY